MKKGEHKPPRWTCARCWCNIDGKRKQNQRYCPACKKLGYGEKYAFVPRFCL